MTKQDSVEQSGQLITDPIANEINYCTVTKDDPHPHIQFCIKKPQWLMF